MTSSDGHPSTAEREMTVSPADVRWDMPPRPEPYNRIFPWRDLSVLDASLPLLWPSTRCDVGRPLAAARVR
jgi:hypothetical protein